MMQPPMIAVSLIAKIEEQIERTEHLIAHVPEERIDFAPPIAEAWTIGMVMGHLLDCLAGFCAVLRAAYPQQLAHFDALRSAPVNGVCTPAQARERIAAYRAHLEQGFALLCDHDLARRVPTVFVPEGETLTTLLLGNLEHLINHKYQLFLYLRMMGVSATSCDLYRFR